MRQLFAPWRHAWVTSAEARGDDANGGECLFCRVWRDASADEPNLVVARGERSVVLLNRYPYNGGHLLVAPSQHCGALEALAPAARAEMIELAAAGLEILRALYHPDGFNMGINQGRAAGAGIPDHVHFHVVPRWNGDTNFMTTVGEGRVVSQDLSQVRAEVAAGFAARASR